MNFGNQMGLRLGTILVKDIWISGSFAPPKYLTNVNGTLIFQANNGNNGMELWKSDGTAVGTVMVKDIFPGSTSSLPRYFANINGTVYFQANDGTHGVEVWKSDGTDAGTLMIKDIWAGNLGADPRQLTDVNETLFFQANGSELWKSDGTTTGTVLVKDVTSQTAGGTLGQIANVNGTLYFAYVQTFFGLRDALWKTDGTTSGTEMIRTGFSFRPTELTNINGTLYFQANAGTSGPELWKSDGTEAGTVMVKEIRAGSGGSYPTKLTNIDGILYFIANDNINGKELWKSDGTSNGTVLVKDIRAGISTSGPTNLKNVNGTLFFIANDGFFGYELWRSDGSAAGTAMVKNIGSGYAGSNPSNLTDVNGMLFFSASDSFNGFELWKSDGTSGGTMMVKDIFLGGSSSPSSFTNVAGSLYFTANDGANGNELWKSNGTAAGTVLVKDIWPGNNFTPPSYLMNFDGTMYFKANDGTHGEELWISDGTSAGTNPLTNFVPKVGTISPSNLLKVGNKLYYSSNTDEYGTELWRLTENKHIDITFATNALAENSGANAVVGTLGTTDVDQGDSFTYSLVVGTGDGDNAAFNINGTNLRATNSFDFETKSNYSIRVRSTDQQGLWIEKIFTISVTDINESPSDIGLSLQSIPENSSVNATVGTLSTTDQDAGSVFTYSLVSGTGDTDNVLFNINGSTLRATNSFDFESKSSYTVRVRSTDQGGLFTEKTFSIAVTNVNETPTDILLSASSISENAGTNATLGSLSTIDPDVGNTFVFTLVSGLGDADNSAFNVSGTSVRATNSFDFEAKSSYTIRVRSTDQAGLFTEKTFAITVTDSNDRPTDIDLSPITIAENAGANATVGILSTSDQDPGNTFTYNVVSGAGDADNAAFSISGATVLATGNLDFETKSSFTIRVRSTDQGGLFTDKSFTISVINVNEAPFDIVLSPNTIGENAGANAAIGSLTTTDPDFGNTFTYSLIFGTGDADNAAFNISGSNLRATNSFDFETKSSYSIRVRTTDQGGLFTDKSFVVSVTNVNETPTDIVLSQNSIAENAGSNAGVGSLTATDPDFGNTFTYALIDGVGDADNAAFNISGSTVRATNSLDFENKSNYSSESAQLIKEDCSQTSHLQSQ